MEKSLSINKFAVLLIATLANNSERIDLKNPENKVAVIPADYKQRIENILCAENGWKNEFSPLINVTDYFEDHFDWEQKLAAQIRLALKKMNKKLKYDLEGDSINISFSQKEIDSILSHFKDENVISAMNHFTALLGDFIYSRPFQEEFHDYSAKSVQYMKQLRTKQDKNAE